ncbi:MAG: glycosyltransferase family 2 protein [Candidatus Marinimicrobia bacterium]|jgi:hypothetical protein|nr:glycosyltransferase family 2 protein [Candidatus Neomarinimicrobiota bacterium]MBT5759414.1 glycosyltransferase family 2 protein [Candidatus Neomarinimicrobiota bacterium]MBT6472174.1 glycosyltransferase family 2 protein [Candidatus Neomarinimicrobiota bacterium]
MIDISVIIVNYNVKEYIINCIDSIQNFTSEKLNYEIIVVDNASEDGSTEYIENNLPAIKLIKNADNIGFSRAVNQGVNMAQGEYLFLLNPDTKLVEDSLNILHSFISENPQIAAIGPKLINKSGKTQKSFWRKPTLINTLLSIYHLEIFNQKKNYGKRNMGETLAVDSISGGAFFVRGNLFNALNGFNENLFWMEDIDCCNRIRKQGFEIIYLPETKIIHFSGKSAEKNWTIAISNQLISKIKYFKLYHHTFEGFILKFAIYILVIAKCAYLTILSPLSRVSRKKRKAYFVTLKMMIMHQY